VGERAEGLEQFAGGPDAAGHDHRAGRRVGDLAGEFGGALGQLVGTRLGLVQLEAVRVAPEGVGEDEVGAGVDEALVQALHPLGVIDRPELGRLTRGEALHEVVGARGAVGEQWAAGGQEIRERGTHRVQATPGRSVDRVRFAPSPRV
jgi:hypothetical protein